MKKVIIVTNAYIRNKSQYSQAERISEELRLLKSDCEIVKNLNLAKIENGDIVSKINEPCVFLDKDRVAARLLEKKGLRLFNSAEAIETCDDKMLTHVALSNNGINMPDCVYAPLCYYADAEINYDLMQEVEKLGFPLIAKLNYGSLGSGVFLIKDMRELSGFENANKLYPHFYQKYTGIVGEDIRAIVIGGRFVCAMLRKNERDFRSNIGLGGRGEEVKPNPKLCELCERVASILKLDYCGIDILYDSRGNTYICEVNSNAFFSEIEKVCKVNIAKKYAEHILKFI